MKKNKFVAALILMLIGLQSVLLAQNNRLENSLLWEVSGNGLKKPSYLYGTFHVRDKRVFQFDKVVFKKLKKCDVVTGELQMNMGSMMLSLLGQLNKFFMPNHQKLDDLYENNEDYQLIKSHLDEKMGILSGMADSLLPFLTASMLGEGQSSFRSDYKYVLDDYFQKLGEQMNKTVKGLETLEEQLDALTSISLETQAKMLLESVKSLNSENDSTEAPIDLIKIYRDQDIVLLDSLVNQSGDDDFSEMLLYKRNEVMSNRIHELIQQQATFNTFGAAHLAGNRGIINLLRKKGYTITPIHFEFNEKNEPIPLK